MFKFFFRYFHDIEIAVESIVSNKLKSMLTALGIIFGVAAVIAMLAIGKGAKQEIMEQMKMVGNQRPCIARRLSFFQNQGQVPVKIAFVFDCTEHRILIYPHPQRGFR